MKQLSLEEIKNKFINIHGNKYDYSKFKEINRNIKDIIICPIHGEFLQSRNHHLRGSGCPSCANVPIGGFKRKTIDDFKNEIKEFFPNLNFDKFIYKNNHTPSIVICNIHGEFKKTPKLLLRKQGCPYCSGKTKGSIEKIQNILDDRCLPYKISKNIEYINNKTHIEIICSKHGSWKVRPDNLINSNHKCPSCSKNYSKKEIEIQDFITNNNILIEKNNKKILDNKFEIDIFIPNYNLGIEFNGLYWHSEISGNKNKYYHLSKTTYCQTKNINLIHIFEDEWHDLNKQKIWKSILYYKLNLINTRIFARKCIIKEISSNIKNSFLLNNHLQGSDKSKINLGLFFNNELVSVMTFCKSRFNKNYKWELSRFCSKTNTIVCGAFGKLLKYFIKTYSPESIITYCDKRFSTGKTYLKYFKLKGSSPPNYFYFLKHETKRYNRINFQKHKLKNILNHYDDKLTEWENMKNNGYDRIWDCGNFVFTYNK